MKLVVLCNLGPALIRIRFRAASQPVTDAVTVITFTRKVLFAATELTQPNLLHSHSGRFIGNIAVRPWFWVANLIKELA